MVAERTVAIDGTDGAFGASSTSRRIYLISAVIYPFWHLAAPSTATDPWILWWIVASSFLLVDWAARRSAFAEQHMVRLRHLCSWSCTLQLYVLAFINDMAPFYAFGSMMAVIANSVTIRTKPDHLAWGGFVFLLSAVLFALDPEAIKLAYWGGMLTIIASSYYRLSAQITAEELTRKHQEVLEGAVRERTSELSDANRRLRREMEERARLEEDLRVSQRLEALGRLAGGVAHEFNNLLTRIRLYAEFALERAPANAELRDDVGEIQKAGRQATSLTRQLLTFSRRGETQIEVIDVNAVIETSSSMLRHLLGENTDLVCLLGKGPHCIRTDRGQLEQVLVNLVLNARDAMIEGGRLTIETSIVRPRHDGASELPDALRRQESVLLAVNDTGVGMDSETRERAFDPFFTRKSVNQGTGLGLSVVYGILKQAGGHVRVMSEPGKGARFELLWPRTRESAAPWVEPGSPTAIRGGNERILLVEDEAELRQALKRLLSGRGYDVLEAEDSQAALRIIAATDGPIQLLLTDVVMPVMNGVDLADTVCRERPETRVLLMSGHMDLQEPLENALPPGVGFVAKPFESEELTAKVREVLDAPNPVDTASAVDAVSGPPSNPRAGSS